MIPTESSRTSGLAKLCALMALMFAAPFGLHALNARFAPSGVPESYLPALEGPRVRTAFEPKTRQQLARLDPAYVVIGDSMAGTRVHATRLSQLAGGIAAPVLQAGSGSAYWYLALKNWVIASGARPKIVFIFFRDTNLTDVMFRLDEGFRWNLDRVAMDEEPALNAAIAARTGAIRFRVQSELDRLYGAERSRLWLVDGLSDRLARARSSFRLPIAIGDSVVRAIDRVDPKNHTTRVLQNGDAWIHVSFVESSPASSRPVRSSTATSSWHFSTSIRGIRATRLCCRAGMLSRSRI